MGVRDDTEGDFSEANNVTYSRRKENRDKLGWEEEALSPAAGRWF